jgi:cyclophilin family peptidyl-prolyl cis-trans isomerase
MTNVKFSLAGLDGGATGSMTVQLNHAWSPKGVDHFLKLTNAGFFDQCRFFRVGTGCSVWCTAQT